MKKELIYKLAEYLWDAPQKKFSMAGGAGWSRGNFMKADAC